MHTVFVGDYYTFINFRYYLHNIKVLYLLYVQHFLRLLITC